MTSCLEGVLNEEQRQEARRHFSQEEYQRMFALALRKWESIGRVGGHIEVENISVSECKRISGLIGIYCQSGQTVKISLVELDRRLRASRWAVGLEDVLTLLTGQPLVSKKQHRKNKESAWEAFCQKGLAVCRRKETVDWWRSVREGKALGTKAIRQLFEQDPARAMRDVLVCLQALDELPCLQGTSERVPVFANRLCGNPHGFDAETTNGRLLYQALCDIQGVATDGSAEWKRAVLQEAGLLPDELSSHVTVLGLRTKPDDRWYDFFQCGIRAKVPLNVTLAFFREPISWEKVNRLYVVENPSVFQSLIDAWPINRAVPPLVCTSGQPSVAALRLMDAMVEKGTEIWYGGDFDWKGIEMACALSRRYGDAFIPWRMSAEEYLSHEKGIEFEEEQLKGLLTLEVPWDGQLVEAMAKRKLKVFQESVLAHLLDDLLAREQQTVDLLNL